MRKTGQLALVSVMICAAPSCGIRKPETTTDGGRGSGEVAVLMDAGGRDVAPRDGIVGIDAAADARRDAAPPLGDAAEPTFAVSGTVAGLMGSGLIIRNGEGNGMGIVAGATQFSFAERLANGNRYAITVVRQPSHPAQTCAATNARGTIASADVTDIAIVCTTEVFTVSGSVSGLVGQGLVLRSQGGEDLSVAAGSSNFSFTEGVSSGSDFAVTVASQPTGPAQTCIVSRGSGTVIDSPVTDVSLVCTTRSFPVGGTINGLSGSGLVLADGGGGTLAVPAGATAFTFARLPASGAAYSIAVLAQPRAPAQLCTVSAGTGTVSDGPVVGPIVSCVTQSFAVGGNVAGLLGAGLVLRDNDGDYLVVAGAATGTATAVPDASMGSGGTTFVFAKRVASGAPFAVTVRSQPTMPDQTCAVSGGRGLVGDGDVTSVVINCVVATFTVGGRVSGLRGPLILRNGLDTQTITADGDFAFSTPVASGSAYDVRLLDPAGMASPTQVCSLSNGTGLVGGANVTDVVIACVPVTHRVHAEVVGLVGRGLVLLDNGGDSIAVPSSGRVTFATALPSGAPYGVSVGSQPMSPSQTCVLVPSTQAATAPPSGIVTSGDVTVSVTCETNRQLIRPAITGLVGAGLVLQVSSPELPTEELSVSGNGIFAFPTPVRDGSPFSIAVTRQPNMPWQTCTATPSRGVLAGEAVIIDVTCALDTFTLGGTVTGLSGLGLVLQNNGGDDLAIPPGATRFSFPAALTSGSSFDVRVKTPGPTSPWQTCTVEAGRGTIGGAVEGSVAVSCVTNTYRVMLDITNVRGSGLVLQRGGGDDLAVEEDGRAVFGTPLASGQPYHVAVVSQPSGPEQTCTVGDADGLIRGEDVILAVTCTTRAFLVGGTVVGLLGSGLVLQNNAGVDSVVVPAGSTEFVFPTAVTSGEPYFVGVGTQPAGQSCRLINDFGVVTDHDVDDVNVVCFSAVCASAREGQTLSISCPPGQAIFDVDFASYGTPGGQCGGFTEGTCAAVDAGDIVYEACLGYESCSVPVGRDPFGDPCPGVDKTLRVQVSCL